MSRVELKMTDTSRIFTSLPAVPAKLPNALLPLDLQGAAGSKNLPTGFFQGVSAALFFHVQQVLGQRRKILDRQQARNGTTVLGN